MDPLTDQRGLSHVSTVPGRNPLGAQKPGLGTWDETQTDLKGTNAEATGTGESGARNAGAHDVAG